MRLVAMATTSSKFSGVHTSNMMGRQLLRNVTMR